jgi:cytochrome c oxidase assembly protein subunit 17
MLERVSALVLPLFTEDQDVPQVTALWSPTPTPPPAKAPYDPTDPKQNPLNPQGLKPYAPRLFPCTHPCSSDDCSCCACPQTKSARDDCFLKFDGSESDEKCKELVQAHLACMRGLGFNI